jgi:hypothetical protein
MTTETFTRKLRNVEGIYYRQDKGYLTGRNATSTDAAIAGYVKTLREAIAQDAQTDAAPLCSFLDDNPKIAARWDKIERRWYGLG